MISDRQVMDNPPLMMDVDTGVDDALAIALAIQSDTNLVGVSTVSGNVSIDLATENSLRVLSWMGAESIPVHRGASRPLAVDNQDAAHVHGENGLGGAELPKSAGSESRIGGVEALLANAARYDGELVLVALGPLTNLAIALSLRPALARQIRTLVIMGGAYFVPGNVTPHAEFNAFADPHACGQVLRADWNEIIAVGLDVTHQTIISSEQWEATPDDATGATGLVKRITGRTFNERKLDGFYLHDPLALAVAFHPDLVETEPFSVSVDVDERRGKMTPHHGGSVNIATSVDGERFEAEFARLMGISSKRTDVDPASAE